MSCIIAKGFDTITNNPLGLIAQYQPDGNNAIQSIGLMAEGGTINQSYYINSLTDAPFNIVPFYLYQDDTRFYSTDIQVFGVSQLSFTSPLGTPRLRFYLCSPSQSSRVATVETTTSGTDVLVSHLTLEEYLTDFATNVETYHSADSPSPKGNGVTAVDNFLQAFDVICNIGTYTIGGVINYLNLYYNDPNFPTKRHKFDILVYTELPFNNINVATTEYPIGVSESTILI
jgi:hypothetical protein